MDYGGALQLIQLAAKLRNAGRGDEAAALIDQARRISETGGVTDRMSDGFTGSRYGEVIDAPWRGEYDMPGNFERGQRISNSLANDALLDAGLGHSYTYDPEKGVDAVYHPFSHAPGDLANQKRWLQDFAQTIHFSGPPDPAKMVLHGNNPRAWDPTWDWVGPEGPPTRESYFRSPVTGRERPGSQRFKDWLWNNLRTRSGRGFALSPLDAGL